MPYEPTPTSELIDRINKRLGLSSDDDGKPSYVDPALQPGFRVKPASELPYYTRETPMQETARISSEYDRAGANRLTYDQTFGIGGSSRLPNAWMNTSQAAMAIPGGVGEGIYSAASTVVDPAMMAMGYGRPMSRDLNRTQDLYNEAGENPVAGFVRNVVKSVTSNVAAAVVGAPLGPAGIAGSIVAVNAIPTAMQEYERGVGEGLTPKQSLARATAYGVVSAAVSPILEKFAPGMSTTLAGGFAKSLADDIGKPLATAFFRRLANTSASEGVEEAIQEIATQFIDAATTTYTGNKNLEKPYASYAERLMDVAQAFGLGVAGGGLVQGGMEILSRMPSTQRFIQQNQDQLAQPVQPPAQQNAASELQQPQVSDINAMPLPNQEMQNAEAAQAAEVPVQPQTQEQPIEGDPRPEELPAPQDLSFESGQVDMPSDEAGAPKVAATPIREFVNTLSEEQKTALAQVETPSRRVVADILGVDANALPPVIAADSGRRAAQRVAQSDIRKQSAIAGTANTAEAVRPLASSQWSPTGSTGMGTRVVPAELNVNYRGDASNETTTIQAIRTDLEQFGKELSGFNTPVSEGVGQKGAKRGTTRLGVFQMDTGAVRTLNRNDMPTLAHEISHMVDRTTDVYRSAPAAAKAEAVRIGQAMGGNYQPNQYEQEGYAEFVRAYMQHGPQFAAKTAPALYDHFTQRMQQKYPKAMRALNAAAQKFSTFVHKMNAEQRVASQIAPPRTMMEKMTRSLPSGSRAWQSFTGNFWDIAEVGRRIETKFREWTKRTTGTERELPPEFRPDRVYDAYRDQASPHANSMIFDQMVDPQGNRTGGESLSDVLSPIAGDEEKLTRLATYLAARRTVAIGDQKNLDDLNNFLKAVLGEDAPEVKPRAGNSSLADAKAAIETLERENPEFRIVADKYYRWWDNVLDYMATMSPTLADAVNRIRTFDPGSYTPFMRDFISEGTASPRSAAASGQIGRKMKGSNRAIRDVFTQAVQVLEQRLRLAHQRAILDSAIALTDRMGGTAWGMAEFIERLPPDVKPDGPFKTVYVNGEKVRFQINDPGLSRLLDKAMEPVSLRSIPVAGPALDIFFGFPARVLKTFATGINPYFGAIVQPAFNSLELLFKSAAFTDKYQSRSAKDPLTAAARRVKNHVSLLRDYAVFSLTRLAQTALRPAGVKLESDAFGPDTMFGTVLRWMEEGDRRGIEYTETYSNDDIAAWVASRRAAGVNMGPVRIAREDGALALGKWAFSAIPKWLSELVNASDFGARMATFKAHYEGRGLDVDQELTQREFVDLMRSVKESHGNYGRRGETARWVEKIAPYWSAGLVHTRSLTEAIRTDPANVAQVGMILFAAAVMLTLKNLLDDEYREADAQQKIRYVHFGDSKNGWTLLPGHSDTMTMFHGTGVAVAHMLFGAGGVDQFKEVLKAIPTQIVNMPGIPLVDLTAALTTGRDARTGRDIVPSYKDKREGDAQATVVSRRPASEQYTDKTTPAAVAIGKLTGVSPMKIEYVIARLGNRWLNDVQTKGILSLVSPRTREAGLLSSKDNATTELYEEIEKANRIKNDPTQKETPEDRDRRLMLESADAARDAYSALMRREKDDKKVAEYSRVQRQLSRTAVDMYRAGKYEHGPFKVAKRLADVDLARLDGETEQVNRLIYNGLDALARKRPVKAYGGKTIQESQAAWQADVDEAKAFKDGLGITREQAMDIARQHMIATKTDARLINVRLQAISRAW